MDAEFGAIKVEAKKKTKKEIYASGERRQS